MKKFILLAVSASVLFGACSKDQLKTQTNGPVAEKQVNNLDLQQRTSVVLKDLIAALPVANQALLTLITI